MSASAPKYMRTPDGGRLWQGEILSGVIQVRIQLDSIGSEGEVVSDEITHPFAIVLAQDCDLESDYGRDPQHQETGESLPNILLCEATTVSSLRGSVPPGNDIWKRIIQNKDERYQCLEEIPADLDATGQRIEPLGIDFKRYFTIPTTEIYKRLDLGQVRRRCRLVTPYMEQLSSRFFYFQARIALPSDHIVT